MIEKLVNNLFYRRKINSSQYYNLSLGLAFTTKSCIINADHLNFKNEDNNILLYVMESLLKNNEIYVDIVLNKAIKDKEIDKLIRKYLNKDLNNFFTLFPESCKLNIPRDSISLIIDNKYLNI